MKRWFVPCLLLLCIGACLAVGWFVIVGQGATVTQLLVPLCLLGVFVLILFGWIGDARVRRLRRGLAQRKPQAWEIKFGQRVCEGFNVPLDLAGYFQPTDTLMSLYLLMYPSHCCYDELELENVAQCFEQYYHKAFPKDGLSMPFAELHAYYTRITEETSHANDYPESRQ